ncbi:MAG TPA: ion channel, partial [Thermoanaerobaculia bacterium]|nr:ion channel [Thermoanaerobaculia bacterium]
RMLNRDGSFNARRHGLPWRATWSVYHQMLELSWPAFLGALVAAYAVLNSLFALGYLWLGPGALSGGEVVTAHGAFWQAFFFSVESLSTVGYGHIVPVSFGAHVLMSVESLVGLLGVAFATGIGFARFSRPRARILFSEKVLMAPYRGGRALMFRIANQRKTELFEVSAKVSVGLFERHGGERVRRFYPLALERQNVTFFPLSWTLVHPIDAESPLRGHSPESLDEAEFELFILLSAIEEAFSQTVHARTSYTAEDLVWGARFVSVFDYSGGEGPIRVDLRLLDAYDPVPTLPEPE